MCSSSNTKKKKQAGLASCPPPPLLVSREGEEEICVDQIGPEKGKRKKSENTTGIEML